MTRFEESAKRLLDLSLGAVFLVLAAPFIVIVAVLIRIVDGPPVIYAQKRPGYRERLFTVYKFRTMRPAASEDMEAVTDGTRLTTLGRFLRRSSLDELPQLWSVVAGDLSLVGPRPLLQRYLPYLTDRERLRHSVPPGLTGWAQLNGRNMVGWKERLELDVWYVEHRSLRLDLIILLRTVPCVLRSTGAVADARTHLPNLDEERSGQSRP